jgi:hypothetical protein
MRKALKMRRPVMSLRADEVGVEVLQAVIGCFLHSNIRSVHFKVTESFIVLMGKYNKMILTNNFLLIFFL